MRGGGYRTRSLRCRRTGVSVSCRRGEGALIQFTYDIICVTGGRRGGLSRSVAVRLLVTFDLDVTSLYAHRSLV